MKNLQNLVKKHAKNFALIGGERKELEGIFYKNDGSIFVTNGFILLHVKGVHSLKESVVKHYNTGKIIRTDYPNLEMLLRVIPKSEVTLNIDHLNKHLGLLKAATDLIDEVVTIKDDLSFEISNVFSERFHLTLKGNKTSDFNPIRLNARYLYYCLQVFKDLRVDKVFIRISGSVSPVLITNKDETVQTIIAPVRRY